MVTFCLSSGDNLEGTAGGRAGCPIRGVEGSFAGKGGGEETLGAGLATDESMTMSFPLSVFLLGCLSAGRGGGCVPLPIEGSGGGLEEPSGTGVLSAIFLGAWIDA
jgi:hypothetical protein